MTPSAARTPCQPSRRRSSHRWLRYFLPMASSGPPKWVYPVLGVLALGIRGPWLGHLQGGVGASSAAPAPPQIVRARAGDTAQPQRQPAAPSPGAPTAAQPPSLPRARRSRARRRQRRREEEAIGQGRQVGCQSPARGCVVGQGLRSPRLSRWLRQPQPQPQPQPKPKKGGSIDDCSIRSTPIGAAAKEPKPKKVATAAVLPSLSPKRHCQCDEGRAAQSEGVLQPVQGCGHRECQHLGGQGRPDCFGDSDAGQVRGYAQRKPAWKAAAKTAKFPPCEAMSFPWPFQLH